MTNTRTTYEELLTDHLLFTLEPGNASRTKFALEMARKIASLDETLIDKDELTRVQEIKAEVAEFLL